MGRLGRKLIQSLSEGKSVWEIYKDKPLSEKLIHLWYVLPIFDPIHSVISFFAIQMERIERFWVYGKHIWRIGEFDYNWHLELLELSLKRLRDIMVNGHCVVTKTKRRKIDTAINLLHRMNNSWETYQEPAREAFDKKWNFQDDLKLLVHPDDITDPKPHSRRWYTSRDAFRNALPPAKQRLYDKEYKENLYVEDKMFNQDMELFCKIFKRHVRSWWD